MNLGSYIYDSPPLRAQPLFMLHRQHRASRSLFKSLRRFWHEWACWSQPDDIVVIQSSAVYETMRSHHWQQRVLLLQCQPTLPSGLADAGLALAATSVRLSTVSHAVGDVTGSSLPVVFTLTVHRAGGVPHTTLAAAGAVVGTCVHPGEEDS